MLYADTDFLTVKIEDENGEIREEQNTFKNEKAYLDIAMKSKNLFKDNEICLTISPMYRNKVNKLNQLFEGMEIFPVLRGIGVIYDNEKDFTDSNLLLVELENLILMKIKNHKIEKIKMMKGLGIRKALEIFKSVVDNPAVKEKNEEQLYEILIKKATQIGRKRIVLRKSVERTVSNYSKIVNKTLGTDNFHVLSNIKDLLNFNGQSFSISDEITGLKKFIAAKL